MPTLHSKTLLQGVLELTISVPPEELTPALERAAVALQASKPLAGFRPGKAPLADVRRAVGEMALLEAAVRYAIPAAFLGIVAQEKLLTIGQPEVEITMLAPNTPLQFTAKVAVLPEVKLGDYKKIREPRRPVTVTEGEVVGLIEELRQGRATHTLVEKDEPATATDRVVVDLAMSREGVPVEGGIASDHAIDLGKPYFVAGFTEQLVGAKADDNKTFTLPFPQDHFQKHLAGRDVDFAVTVKGVYRPTVPPLDDALAVKLGPYPTLAVLRERLHKNLLEMHEAEEDARLERAIITTLIKQTKFGELPAVLVNSELERMMARVSERITREGGTWDDYLTHLKKTPEELADDWRPEAVTRAQAALLVRAIADAEDITVTPEEVAAERAAILSHYADDPDTQAELTNAEYDEHIKHIILTRKVMEKLKAIATAKP